MASLLSRPYSESEIKRACCIDYPCSGKKRELYTFLHHHGNSLVLEQPLPHLFSFLAYGKGCNSERLRRNRELPAAATQIEGCTCCAAPSQFRTARFAPLIANLTTYYPIYLSASKLQRKPAKTNKDQRRPAARSGAALN
jgi:hypothetical protein